MMVDNNPQPRMGGANRNGASTRGSAASFNINLTEPTKPDELAVALADFQDEARKTPRERCRDQVMKEWHITKEDIDALPPKEAQALNDRIEQEVARRMQCAAPGTSQRQDGARDAEAAAEQALQPLVQPLSPGDQLTTMQAFSTRIPGLGVEQSAPVQCAP